MISKIKYKRVLLKLSGEALLGNNSHGIDEKIIAFRKFKRTNVKAYDLITY